MVSWSGLRLHTLGSSKGVAFGRGGLKERKTQVSRLLLRKRGKERTRVERKRIHQDDTLREVKGGSPSFLGSVRLCPWTLLSRKHSLRAFPVLLGSCTHPTPHLSPPHFDDTIRTPTPTRKSTTSWVLRKKVCFREGGLRGSSPPSPFAPSSPLLLRVCCPVSLGW